MNAPHEEAVEFGKLSKRENRVYVGNLSYDVKYRDLMEFMRGGGWGNNLRFKNLFIRRHFHRLWEREKDRESERQTENQLWREAAARFEPRAFNELSRGDLGS